MIRRRLGRISVFMFLMVLIGGSISASASDGQWNSVIRPGVNAGTGTADYTVEMLSPLYQNASSMLFFNPRFRINPGLNDEDEYNLGLGYRRLILNDNWYLGGNVFYDSMSSANDFDYHQVGLGVEARSKWLDVILNGYIQTGKTKHRLTSYDTFSLGSHALMRHDGYEEAMSGMDGEVGVLVPFISDYVETRAYLGGYWWVSGVASDVTGFRARVQVDPVPLLTMNAIYSNDNVRNSVWRGEAYLNIPFSFENVVHGKNPFAGIKDALKFGKGPRDARERMTDRVERDRYIQTKAATSSSAVAVHDMIYVNNANTSGTQDGSIEHPYSTLAGAQADGRVANTTASAIPYIYIFKGNGAAYTDGLTLVNNAAFMRSYMIWGEGYTLPGMHSAGNPVLTTNGITFGVGAASAGDLTVRGLTVDGASGDGLYAAKVRRADIYDNVFSNNGTSGIHIDTTYSPATTDDVDINIHGNTTDSNGLRGISCNAINNGAAGNVNVAISGNTSNGNSGDNIYAYAENDATGDGTATLTVTGNHATGSTGGYGIDAKAYNYVGGNGDTAMTISGNKANDNNGNNIYADAENDAAGDGTTTLNITGNKASQIASPGSGYYGIESYVYRAYNTGVNGNYGVSGNVNMTISGNTANGNSNDNIYAYAENDATGDGSTTLTVSGNQANGSTGGYGIGAEAYRAYNGSGTSGDVNMTISGNTANNNSSNNIDADAGNYAGDGSTTINITGNKASQITNPGSGRFGIYAYAYNYAGGSGDTTLTISDNSANNNYDTNIYADAENDAADSGSTNLTISGNQASGSTGGGIDAEAYRAYNVSGTSGDVNATISGNTANGNSNSNDNIYAYADNEASGDGTTTLTVSGNQANGSTGGGIDAKAYRAYNGSGTSGDVNMTISGNTANGNSYDNIYADAENDVSADGSTNMTVSDNQASGSTGSYGIDAEAYNYAGGNGDATASVTGNTANDNSGDNIYAEAYRNTGNGSATLAVSGNQANGSTGSYGIQAYAENYGGSGNASLDLSNNTATGNSSDDLYADVEGNAAASPYDAYFSGSGNTYGFISESLVANGSIYNTFQP